MTDDIKILCETINKLVETNITLTKMLTGQQPQSLVQTSNREVLSSNSFLSQGKRPWKQIRADLENRYRRAEDRQFEDYGDDGTADDKWADAASAAAAYVQSEDPEKEVVK